MQSYLLLIALFVALFTSVQADYRALLWEAIYFYHAYKIQWASGVDPMTMGGEGCRRSETVQEMCGFRTYFKEFMPEEFNNHFHPAPEEGDPNFPEAESMWNAYMQAYYAVRDQGKDQEKTLRYTVTTVDSTFAERQTVPLVEMIEWTTKNVFAAATFGGMQIDVNDIQAMYEAGISTVKLRLKNSLLLQAVARLFRLRYPEYQEYLEYYTIEPYGIDWDKTLRLVEDKVRKRSLPLKEARVEANKIRALMKGFPEELKTLEDDEVQEVVLHQLVIKALRSSIRSLEKLEYRWEEYWSSTRNRPPLPATNPQLDAGNDGWAETVDNRPKGKQPQIYPPANPQFGGAGRVRTQQSGSPGPSGQRQQAKPPQEISPQTADPPTNPQVAAEDDGWTEVVGKKKKKKGKGPRRFDDV